MVNYGRPVEERFWALVDRRGSDECWLWLASTKVHVRTGLRYGQFKLNEGQLEMAQRRCVGAHRVAFRILQGYWPDNALHGCDNTLCCNAASAAHVHDGSIGDNNREMFGRARARPQGQVPLSLVQVELIRSRYRPGVTQEQLAREFGVSQVTISNALRKDAVWRV